MKLYVIRHGQSEANYTGVHSGWSQVPLTETGRQGAMRTGMLLKDIPFQKIYSSDLLRAIQTCNLALPSAVPECSALLREIDVGTLVGVSPAECEKMYGDRYTQARKNRDFTAFDGESHAMRHERTCTFMQQMEKSGVDGPVAVFCHEGVVKCMLDYVLRTAIAPDLVSVKNESVSVFEWNGARWRMIGWNIGG